MSKKKNSNRGQIYKGLEGVPLPLNQKNTSTCVAYAFSQTLSQNLRMKYGIPIDPKKLVEKIKGLHPCWDGNRIDQICNDWNRKYKDESHWLENDDQDGKLYSVCIESSKLEDISRAKCIFELLFVSFFT